MTRFAPPGLVVVKVGSSSLRRPDGRLDRDRIATLADQVAAVRRAGSRVAVVSSGAVAAGMGVLGLDERPGDLPALQACAAVGQGELIHTWQRELARHDLPAAQILLSQDDVVRRGRFLNARTTLARLLALGAVPVVNENDAVATDELAYGDNDHLAALLTTMVEADLLVLLSDVEGLLSADPAHDPRAALVRRVDDLGALDLGLVGGIGSTVGSGGMRSKVRSAAVAVRAGRDAVVADARAEQVLPRVVAGEDVGTWFVRRDQPLEARRLWIGYALTPRGALVVDDGAVRALRERGTSLLAVGVTAATGAFEPGDAVEVRGPDSALVARGLVRYGIDDVRRLLGRSTAQARAELGAGYAREVVHRDDLVMLV